MKNKLLIVTAPGVFAKGGGTKFAKHKGDDKSAGGVRNLDGSPVFAVREPVAEGLRPCILLPAQRPVIITA